MPDTPGLVTITPGQFDAVLQAIDVLSEWCWDSQPCSGFSCSEANRLADFARSFGRDDVAEGVLDAHASGDDDEGDDEDHVARRRREESPDTPAEPPITSLPSAS